MSQDTYSAETVRKVYDDSCGDHIYVGPDADGLDLVELRYVDSKGVISSRISMPKPLALLVAEAMIAAAKDEVKTVPRK
jgi:hypothetical protein